MGQTKQSAKPSAQELAKALAHPLRVRILTLLGESQVASPNMIASGLDEGLGNVSYHMKTLRDFNCVKLVKTEPRRGAVEHFYRATGNAVVNGVTLSPAQAKLAKAAISDALELSDTSSEVDGAGRTENDRKELEKLIELLVVQPDPQDGDQKLAA